MKSSVWIAVLVIFVFSRKSRAYWPDYVAELDVVCPMQLIKSGFRRNSDLYGVHPQFAMATVEEFWKTGDDDWNKLYERGFIHSAPWFDYTTNYNFFANHSKRLLSCMINLTKADCILVDRTCIKFSHFWKVHGFERYERRAMDQNMVVRTRAMCYYFCVQVFNLRKVPMENFNKFCPSPCKNEPCYLRLYNHQTGKCIATGILRTQYKCECEKGYEWDSASYRCLAADPCQSDDKDIYPCNRQGTMFCQFDGKTEKSFCLCDAKHTGLKCEKRFDSCKSKSGQAQLIRTVRSGDSACNINNGNRCIHNTETNTYECRCSQYWTHLMNFSYDNCLKRRSKCDRFVCINGNCKESADGKQAVCECDPEYYGNACELWGGNWSPWSVWKPCRPSCGKKRFTLRSRSCLSAKSGSSKRKDCVGPTQEFRVCRNHPCSYIQQDIVVQIFSLHRIYFFIAILCNIILAGIFVILWRIAFNGVLYRALYNLWINQQTTDEDFLLQIDDLWEDEHQIE